MRQKIDIGSVILKTIAVAGVLSIAVLAPNALQILDQFGYGKKRYPFYINRSLQGLERKGFVVRKKNTQGIICIHLTQKGKEVLSKYEIGQLTIKKPKKWDGKFRIIIFDIKEHRRIVRDDLRIWLNHLGFVRLQQSVWVYPYECRDIIILLKSYFHVGRDILYLTVESIENDKWLKEHFDLK